MELDRAMEILRERVKIDRQLRGGKVEDDYDEFCETECIAIETVLKELEEYKKRNEKLENEAILLRMTHDYDVRMIDEVKGDSVELFKTIDMMAEDLLDDSMRKSFWITHGIKDKGQVKRYYWDKLENKK